MKTRRNRRDIDRIVSRPGAGLTSMARNYLIIKHFNQAPYSPEPSASQLRECRALNSKRFCCE